MLKGLIIKDLYSVRFQIIAGFFIMLLPNIELMLASFNGLEDGIINTTVESLTLRLGLCAAVSFVNIVLFSSFVLNAISDDISSGWNKIQRTFPLSGSNIVGAKLIATYIIIGILTLTSVCFNIGTGLIHGYDMEFFIACPVCIGLMQITLVSPLFPLSLKFGAKGTNVLYLAAEILSIIGVVILVMADFDLSDPPTAFRLEFYLGLPALAALSAVISYFSGNAAVRKITE